MANTKYSHSSQFVYPFKPIVVLELEQGDLIKFQYKREQNNKKQKSYDKNPFVFFLGRDSKHDVIHGINLNYLNRFYLSEFFLLLAGSKIGTELLSERELKKRVSITISNINIGFGGLAEGAQEPAGDIVYERFIKKFLTQNKLNAYRTYKISQVKNIKNVNYNWDISRIKKFN